MWTHAQRQGIIRDESGKCAGVGYSGHGEGKNNPELQDVHGVGPIPQGHWTILGPPEDMVGHGPFVLRLEPKDGTQTFGRTGFLMHGDSSEHPGQASLGCIVMPRVTREDIWASGDRDLHVIESEEP